MSVAHPPPHLLTRRSTCSLLPQSIDLCRGSLALREKPAHRLAPGAQARTWRERTCRKRRLARRERSPASSSPAKDFVRRRSCRWSRLGAYRISFFRATRTIGKTPKWLYLFSSAPASGSITGLNEPAQYPTRLAPVGESGNRAICYPYRCNSARDQWRRLRRKIS